MASPGRAAVRRGRFIVRWTGVELPPADDSERLQSTSEVRIIDSSSRMLLVEGPEAALQAVVDDMPGWLIVPEQQIERPDPRRKARRPR